MPPLILVGLVRIELTTSPLSGVRSSQLSYRPISVTSFRFRVSRKLLLETRNLKLETGLNFIRGRVERASPARLAMTIMRKHRAEIAQVRLPFCCSGKNSGTGYMATSQTRGV